MLECYHTVLSNVGQILEIKLRAQAIVNYLATILLALPLFLLLGPTLRFFEVTYFLVAATLCVPVFTMLAIAIGTYFPNSSRTPQFLGIRIKGALLYFVLTLPIYSLLLELHGDLLLGKKIVSLFAVTTAVGIAVTILSLVLYFMAKRKLAFSTT